MKEKTFLLQDLQRTPNFNHNWLLPAQINFSTISETTACKSLQINSSHLIHNRPDQVQARIHSPQIIISLQMPEEFHRVSSLKQVIWALRTEERSILATRGLLRPLIHQCIRVSMMDLCNQWLLQKEGLSRRIIKDRAQRQRCEPRHLTPTPQPAT